MTHGGIVAIVAALAAVTDAINGDVQESRILGIVALLIAIFAARPERTPR